MTLRPSRRVPVSTQPHFVAMRFLDCLFDRCRAPLSSDLEEKPGPDMLCCGHLSRTANPIAPTMKLGCAIAGMNTGRRQHENRIPLAIEQAQSERTPPLERAQPGGEINTAKRSLVHARRGQARHIRPRHACQRRHDILPARQAAARRGQPESPVQGDL
jgi:hypothetical protein